jgi:hypothetical protein
VATVARVGDGTPRRSLQRAAAAVPRGHSKCYDVGLQDIDRPISGRSRGLSGRTHKAVVSFRLCCFLDFAECVAWCTFGVHRPSCVAVCTCHGVGLVSAALSSRVVRRHDTREGERAAPLSRMASRGLSTRHRPRDNLTIPERAETEYREILLRLYATPCSAGEVYALLFGFSRANPPLKTKP